MLLEMLRRQGDELLADLLLEGHDRFLSLRIMDIISQTIIICREEVSDDFLLIRMSFLIHYALYHRITVRKGFQALRIQGIEMICLELESFLETDRKVEGVGERLLSDHSEAVEVFACLDGLDDLSRKEYGHRRGLEGIGEEIHDTGYLACSDHHLHDLAYLIRKTKAVQYSVIIQKFNIHHLHLVLQSYKFGNSEQQNMQLSGKSAQKVGKYDQTIHHFGKSDQF